MSSRGPVTTSRSHFNMCKDTLQEPQQVCHTLKLDTTGIAPLWQWLCSGSVLFHKLDAQLVEYGFRLLEGPVSCA